MKVGLTFATSIPAAVISMGLFQLSKKPTSALQNNFVQTIASSAGALSNVFMAIPALILIGWWTDFPYWITFLVTLTGGVLGVLFTIPLRQAFVVRSKLPYPEGIACAEIIKAGETSSEGGASLKPLAAGSLVSALFTLLTECFHATADHFTILYRATATTILRCEGSFSLALVGSGYLMGIPACFTWFIGTIFAWDVLVPYFQNTLTFLVNNDVEVITLGFDIWHEKVRLMGAGVIAIASLWILIKLCKPVLAGIKQTLFVPTNEQQGADNAFKDLPASVLAMIGGAFITLLFILCGWFLFDAFTPSKWLFLTSLGVISCVGIGLIVASACGYMAGLLGSSSSPISGIGVIGVLAIGSIMYVLKTQHFLTVGQTDIVIAYSLFLMSVIMASCAVANDNLQDLKTGSVLKASPWVQEVALLIGCTASAVIIPFLLSLLYSVYGFAGHVPHKGMSTGSTLPIPQAALLADLAQAVMFNHLDWSILFAGVVIGIISIIIDSVLSKTTKDRFSFPPLALGLGLYLPCSNAIPVMIGALLALTSKEPMKSKNVLLIAGLIVGESFAGVGSAILQSVGGCFYLHCSSQTQTILATTIFAGILFWSYRKVRS